MQYTDHRLYLPLLLLTHIPAKALYCQHVKQALTPYEYRSKN
ncbi:hypothetical protein RNAN_3754 [Rheinheimera nanhaiensis E407-8]|uniref:Uncharacterized protein n=1 Tax=Rheinheimera nanhaiensis E407-8 TaxID=562729 RepID=I1E350_9GAMM|nr:hypothetical protein RNAN_3754 [Rheinheimera nanhaiensis E407-8]